MPQTKKVVLGRVPFYRGDWVENIPYYRQNMVSFCNGLFVSKVDNNLGNEPVAFIYDEDGRTIGYIINMNWKCVANAYDASIYAMQQGDAAREVADQIDSLFVVFDDYDSTEPNDLQIYTTRASQRMMSQGFGSRIVSNINGISLNDTSIFSTSGADKWIEKSISEIFAKKADADKEPSDTSVYTTLGTHEVIKKSFDQRIVSSENALREDPNDTSVYSMKAVKSLLGSNDRSIITGSTTVSNDTSVFNTKATRSVIEKTIQGKLATSADINKTPTDSSVFTMKGVSDFVSKIRDGIIVDSSHTSTNNDSSVFTTKATKKVINDTISVTLVKSTSVIGDPINDSSVFTTKALKKYIDDMFSNTPYAVYVN